MEIAQSLQETIAADAARDREHEFRIAQLVQRHQKNKQLQVVKKLSTHIDNVWKQVKKANKQPRLDNIKLLRRVRGEYDPAKLANIRAFKGSESYIRTAENKCRSAFSWITDIYRGDTDLPWDIEPTAVPSLPDETKQSIQSEIFQRGLALQQLLEKKAAMTGEPYNQSDMIKTMNDWQKVAEQMALEQMQKDAKNRCEKAAAQIRDDNEEGGWADAFKEFLWYFIRCKIAIIKGPVLSKEKKQVWGVDETGKPAFVTQDVLKTDVYCVSPFNFYPAKGIATVNDGDLIEVHELTRQSLTDMIGVPGYDEAEIRAVLDAVHSGDQKAKWLVIDDEQAVKQVTFEKVTVNASTPITQPAGSATNEPIQALEYYGSVPGALLIEWGLNEDGVDPNQEYQTNCWKIGDHTIKAVINPDNLGRKPYHVSSWAKNPLWLIGESLMEMAEPLEDILNAITRAMQNNIAIGSGPQIVKNKDFCDDKTGIFPLKVWEVTSSMMEHGNKPVDFFSPNMNTTELIAAWQFFSKVLDEMTVPAYAQGASQSGVTAGTATVFTQLLAAASRSIKAVVANLDDDIIAPYIQMCYDNLMKFSDDESLKGDAAVVAKGVSGLLAKEQQAQRKTELLNVVANPVFSQILGAKNIGSLLAQVFKASDITLPDMDRLDGSPTIDQLLQQMTSSMAGVQNPNQANGQVAAGGTPPNAAPQQMPGQPAPGAPDQQTPAQIGA